MFTQITQIPNTSLCNTCIVFIIIYFKYPGLIVCELSEKLRDATLLMRANQTKPATYKYLFDRNAPLCIIINRGNW